MENRSFEILVWLQHVVPSSSDLSVSRSLLFSSDTVSDVQPSEFSRILLTNLTHFIKICISHLMYTHLERLFDFSLCYKRCFNWLKYQAVSPNNITGPFNFYTPTFVF